MWQGSAERRGSGAPSRKGLSPTAQAGSEPQVSHEIDATIHSHPDGPPALLVGEEMATPLRGGTTSSNPSCSTGESFRLARSIGSQTTFAPRAGSVSSNANRAKHPAVPRPYLGVGDSILPRTRASA